MPDPRDDRRPVTPAVFYEDADSALVWLEQAFGFETRLSVTDSDGKVQHAEMSYRGGRITVGPAGWSDWAKSPKALGGANSGSVSIDVDDVDAHCAHARAAGAVIVREPADQFYGDRSYSAMDPEGHCWSFSQFKREVSVEEMLSATGLKVEYL